MMWERRRRRNPEGGSIPKPRVASKASAPWVGRLCNVSTPKGFNHRRAALWNPCGVRRNVRFELPRVRRVAATLGCGMKPLRGKDDGNDLYLIEVKKWS